jgi:Lar family restriction alleviation protein
MSTLTVEQEKLLPCPFCAHTHGTSTAKLGNPEPEFIYGVLCEKCEAQTSWHSSLKHAIAAWNRRSPPFPKGAVSVVKPKGTEETGSDRPAAPIRIGNPCPVCATGKIGQSGVFLRCANCGWLRDPELRAPPPPPADVPKRTLSVEDITATEASFRDPPADVQAVERVAGQLGQLRDFLSGEASYGGHYFGEKHSQLKGAFWWRTVMRETIDRAITFLQQRPFSEGVFGRTDLPQVMVYTARIQKDMSHGLEGEWHQMVMFAEHQRALDAVRANSFSEELRQAMRACARHTCELAAMTQEDWPIVREMRNHAALLTRAADGNGKP